MDLRSVSPHAGVGGHHQHHVAEVRLAPVVVGQRPVVHHLQQDVEHVRCVSRFHRAAVPRADA